jgi:Ca2+-binding EF-hand superfamily protein
MSASDAAVAEAFEIFDRDNDGKISKGEVATAIRALGKAPSNDEMARLLESVPAQVDLATFRNVYAKKMPLASEQQKPMLDAFQALDKERSGSIDVAQLRQILSTLGDPLSADEIGTLFKELGVDASSGQVQYAPLVTKLATAFAVDKRPPPLT